MKIILIKKQILIVKHIIVMINKLILKIKMRKKKTLIIKSIIITITKILHKIAMLLNIKIKLMTFFKLQKIKTLEII
jgi:hypothetical protein